MLNADCAPYFETCPRCGIGGFERLKTHGYCVSCNFSDVDDYPSVNLVAIPKWAIEILKAGRNMSDDSRRERLVQVRQSNSINAVMAVLPGGVKGNREE